MTKLQENIRLFVEYTWLLIAVVAAVFAIYSIVKYGFYNKDSLSFIVICAVSVMMFLLRRKTRLSQKKK